MIARRAAAALWPYRWRVLLALGQIAAISLVELLKPWPLQLVVDSVLGGQPPRWPLLHGWSREALLVGAAAGLVLVWVVSGALLVWNIHTTVSVGQALVTDLRARLYAHLQRLSLSFHARAGIGDLLYRVTGDTYAIQTLTMNGFVPVVSAVLLLAGMTAVMLQLDVRLTAVALGIVPLLLAGIAVANRPLAAAANEQRVRESAVFQLVQRTLAAIRVVQAFAAEAGEQRRFLARSRASLRSGLRLYTMQSAYGAASGVLTAAGTAVVLVAGSWQVWAGHITVGELLVFLGYVAGLYAPVNTLVQTYGVVQGARAGVARVYAVLDGEPPMPDGTRDWPGPVRGRIELRGVSYHYPNGRAALRDITLRIEPGECLAIVGASGAGKSTLVSLLPRLFDPSAGTVLIDGLDVRTLRLAALRRAIAMVLQPPIAFPASVHDNIAYGCPAASRAGVEAAARLAQAHEFITRLPAGYDTVLGEQGATLSEGERQRLTIARAVLRDAPILVFDEPTAALDTATEAALLGALDTVIAGRTTLIIAHRLSTLRRATRVAVLEDGALVELGTPAELLARGGAFARLHTAQVADTSMAG